MTKNNWPQTQYSRAFFRLSQSSNLYHIIFATNHNNNIPLLSQIPELVLIQEHESFISSFRTRHFFIFN
jgi:hypothetical protein